MSPTQSTDAVGARDERGIAAAELMLRVVSYAETIGVVPRSVGDGTDLQAFTDAVEALGALGVARHVRRPDATASGAASQAAAVLAAIEQSPLPAAEWGAMSAVLGDRLPALLGISPSSAVRYRTGGRVTPDPVAARLHVIAQVVSDLGGSYNDFGIRRWFARPRHALDGHAPDEILTGNWAPEDPQVERVRDLARSLLGAGAA